MNKYKSFSTFSDWVDLHDINGPGRPILEAEVWEILDEFIMAMRQKYSSRLKKGFLVQLGVVVGKGVRSRNLISGKNPLRVYAENYLNEAKYNYRLGKYGEGEEGVLVLSLE